MVYQKYWADMHSNIHPQQMKDLPRWYQTAKDLLDFWPIAYYPYQMTKTETGMPVEDLIEKNKMEKDWADICAFSEKANAEGYPMFVGYEWQGDGSDGDHNVFSLQNNIPMLHPRKYAALVKAYQGLPVIGIPHHLAYQPGSRGKNWDTQNDQFSPFAEIYSSHGSSENDDGPFPMQRHVHMGPRTGQTCYEEGLNRGRIVGCIASGDNHDMPAVYGNGLMCALAESNKREDLWNALMHRRVYGVSASRIGVDFTIDGNPMGSVISLGKRHLSFDVTGTSAVDRIEILRNNILEKMVVHSGTWEKKQEENEITFKICFQFGWGPDPRIYPAENHHLWHGQIHTDGKILSVEKCWHHFGQQIHCIDKQDVQFDLTTYQSAKSDKWMAQNSLAPESFILEIKTPVDSSLQLNVNGISAVIPIREALHSSSIIPCSHEASELIQSHWGNTTFYRDDAWWHNTYKIKVSKAYPSSSYLVHHEQEIQLEKGDQVRLRIFQKNGHAAWTSPVFIR